MQKVTLFFKNNWPFFAGLFVVLFFFAFNVTGIDLAYYPGDMGDGRFNTYILEHSHKFLTFQEASLWEASFMYPEPQVITYSDNLVGSAPFYSIWRIFADRETSFQLWFICMYFLNFTFCYLFLNSVFKNKYAAVLGAMVFAASIALQSQMTHAQTFPRFPIPIAFWMAHKFYKDLSPKYIFLTVLAVVYQFYCGIYLGFLLLIPISFFVIGILWIKRIELLKLIKTKRWVINVSAGFILNLGLLLLLMIPYIARAGGHLSSYEQIIDTVPTIKSHLYSQQGSYIWDFLSKTGEQYPAFWDHQIFAGGISILGFLAFIIAIPFSYFILKKKKEVNPFYVLMVLASLLTFLLFTRYQGYSLYKIIFQLPGYGSMRSLARIINIELIFYAFGVGFVANQILKKYKSLAVYLFSIGVLLILSDNYFKSDSTYRTDKAFSQEFVHDLTDKMKHLPKDAIISYEPKDFELRNIYYHIDAMLAAQTLNFKSINGYTATVAEGYYHYAVSPNEKNRLIWFEAKNFQPDTVYIISD